MKVQQCSSIDNNNVKNYKHADKSVCSPSFKAGGADVVINTAGNMMQWIQSKGFLASFLIQDGLGMTAPRVVTGFLRDKEVTGNYNVQEGFEVLGREGMTGPCMMAVAPLAMLVAARFGKTTSVNSQLIRRFGNSFKEFVSNSNAKELIKDKLKFKDKFFSDNLRNMLDNTLGKGNYTDADIQTILEYLRAYENVPVNEQTKKLFGKRKYKSEQLAKITEYINNLKYKSSSDLDLLGKVKFGVGEDAKVFSTSDVLDAMIKYSDDAFLYGSHCEKLDSIAADTLRDKSIAKRFITNIATIASTLGVLSVLPKIYARSNVAPGARTAMQLKENAETEDTNTELETVDKNLSFKGKKPNKSLFEKFGKFIREHTNEKFSSELEYNGINFTNTLMAGLSLFGLLTPRGLRAYNRAQVDENGKKDLTELYEILIRDISSTLAVVFAVPMLTRAFVTSYEKSSGFVLLQKDRNKSGLRTTLDLLNPYSSTHVLTNDEIKTLYNSVDSKEKMLNFCEYINKNDGDLHKILSKSDSMSEIFNESTFKLKDIEKLSKAEKNNKIIKLIKDMEASGKSNEAIKKLMKDIAKTPKGLNSIPAVISMVFISPFILGWLIPRATYANTRRIHAEQEQKKKEKINVAV